MTAVATLLVCLLLLALALLAAPFVLEALRQPVEGRLRAKAPGAFAMLSAGATHYQWHGSRSERVIVLVHGLATPSWVFDGLIRGLLALNYRVLTYDLYGRGHSDRPGAPQTLAFHARQLGELLDALGVNQPVTLLGYSMGGAIVTRFAATESDRVERVVLLAPAGMGYVPGRLLAVTAAGGRFGDWLWGLVGGWVLTRAPQPDPGGESALPGYRRQIRGEARRRGFLAAVLSSERHALAEGLGDDHREIAAMYIPTLAIWGAADEAIAITGVGQLAVWNRQARQEVLEGAPHSLVYTRCEAVLEAIRLFLRELPE